MLKTADPLQERKLQLLKILAGAGLIGAGAGVGLRSAVGLKAMLMPTPQSDTGSAMADPIEIPPHQKLAQVDLTNSLTSLIPDSFVPGPTAAGSWSAPALALPAALASAYAGYRGTDSVIANIKKKRRAQELAAAKQEFEAALRQQFKSAMDANDHPLDQAFTKMADLLSTIGSNTVTGLANTFGSVLGAGKDIASNAMKNPTTNRLLGYYLGMLLTGAGVAAHKGFSSERASQKARNEEALRARRRMRGVVQPLYAEPQDVG